MIQAGTDAGFVPVETRLLAAPGAPVALLPGPAPSTRMRPPTPRATRPLPIRLAERMPVPLRRLLRRARRAGRAVVGAPALMGRRRLGSRVWHRLRRARLPAPGGERRGRRGDRAVVVLADSALPDLVDTWSDAFSGDHLTVLSVDGASDLDSVVASMLRLPAQDVVVVVLGDGALASLASDHGELFARLALHVRGGGTYTVDRRAGDRQAVPGLNRDNSDIARFIKSIDVAEDLVVVTKRGRHALTLREHQVGDLLPGTRTRARRVDPRGADRPAGWSCTWRTRRTDPVARGGGPPSSTIRR